MNMAKRKKQSTPQSVKKDDVFKVKNKSSKKSKTASIKVLKAKSRQALQHGRDVLDDKFVQLHQQQSRDTSHNESPVQYGSGEQRRTQTVDVEDAIDQLAKL